MHLSVSYLFKTTSKNTEKIMIRGGEIMSDREAILNVLMQEIGEEGCGVACEEATVFKDEDGW